MAEPRRRHSTGCPAKTGGRCRCSAGWEASVYTPRDGQIRRTFPTKGEARAWQVDAAAAAKAGGSRIVPTDRRTVAVALREFTDGMEAGTVRPRGRASYAPATVRSYEQSSRLYLIPALGSVKLTELRRGDVQDLANELLAGGFAPSSVSNILNPLQALYGRLVDRDEITYNPATRIDLPAKRSLKPARIATPKQAAAMIEALPVSDRPLRATAFYAGLRRGELQALRVSDVDLSKSEIRVERGWDQVEGAKKPKYESVRTVPLFAVLRDFLDHLILTTGRSGGDLIFGRTASQAFAPMTIDKRARQAWEAAGLEPMGLHDCRHTFASLLIDSGENAKAIQTVMGHKKITTTYEIYGHLLDGALDQMRVRMDAYLEAHAGPTNAPTNARPETPTSDPLA